MVETISPVGYGDRTGRWLAAVALHAIGATATAAAFGALLGAAGSLLRAPWGAVGLAMMGIVAILYAAREAFGLPMPVPAARRQVPDWWRSFFSWPVAATLYGAGLGIGFLTYLTNGGLVVVAAAALLSGRVGTGALLVGVFGLARGLSALVAWPVRSQEAGGALVDRLAATDPATWRRVNAVALSAVSAGAASAVAVATPVPGLGDRVATAAAGTVALFFAWSAIAKLVAPASWRRVLAGYGLPRPVERAVPPVLPALELAVPAAVVLGAPAAACALAVALLLVFSGVILRTRLRGDGDRIACGCFGGASARDYRALLARNAALAAVAVGGARAPAQAVAWWPAAPEPGELLPFVLAVAGTGVALLTVWRSATWLRGQRPI